MLWEHILLSDSASERQTESCWCGLRALCACPCLHVFLAAGIGAGFYLGYSWLPSFFTKHAGIPQSLTLWMVLSGMVIFTFVVPVSILIRLLWF